MLQVGRLNICLLPFDHADGVEALPWAIQAYHKIKSKFPNAIPFFEYFVPEIEEEIKYKPPPPGTPVSPNDEFGNIRATYDSFVNQTGIEEALVADPAYNRGFAGPEIVPIVGGLAAAIFAMRKSIDAMAKSDKTSQSRRTFLAGVGRSVLGLIGMSTLINETLQTQTGTTTFKGFNPPELPGAVVSETDFRILAIAQALNQLGQTTDSTGIQDVIFVYPQAHIDRIKEVFNAGGVARTMGSLKFDTYKVLYNWLGIMKIRIWNKIDGDWKKTKEIPIDFAI